MNPITCRRCGCRLAWAEGVVDRDAICLKCAECETVVETGTGVIDPRMWEEEEEERRATWDEFTPTEDDLDDSARMAEEDARYEARLMAACEQEEREAMVERFGPADDMRDTVRNEEREP